MRKQKTLKAALFLILTATLFCIEVTAQVPDDDAGLAGCRRGVGPCVPSGRNVNPRTAPPRIFQPPQTIPFQPRLYGAINLTENFRAQAKSLLQMALRNPQISDTARAQYQALAIKLQTIIINSPEREDFSYCHESSQTDAGTTATEKYAFYQPKNSEIYFCNEAQKNPAAGPEYLIHEVSHALGKNECQATAIQISVMNHARIKATGISYMSVCGVGWSDTL